MLRRAADAWAMSFVVSKGSSHQHADANNSASCGTHGATETPNGYGALDDCSLAALWDPSDATALPSETEILTKLETPGPDGALVTKKVD